MNPYLLRVAGLPADYFTLHALRGLESISSAYSFRLTVTADKSSSEDVEGVALGQRAQLTFHAEEHERAFHGVIAAIRISDRVSQGRTHYRMKFVPRLWLLHRKRRTRIFQDMRVSDVVSKVLLEEGIATRWQLARSYPTRAYCTQYEETDYAFITRILAEAGIYFYFACGGPIDGALSPASTVAAAVAPLTGTASTPLGSAAFGAAAVPVRS